MYFGIDSILQKNRNCRLAVYGTGKNARKFIAQYGDLNIVCVLDGKRNSGEFDNRPVASLESVRSYGIDIIIIATSISVEKIVFDRIKTFCRDNAIKIYGMHLGDMVSAIERGFWGYDNHDCLSIENIHEQIACHDVISFDVFDTVLMRQTLYPDDVFDLVEAKAYKCGIDITNFKMWRIRAERNVLHTNHSLDGIYKELGRICGISNEICEKLLNIELSIEKSIIVPRESIVQCMKYAKKLNKRVYLITDMYLSYSALKDILHTNGIVFYDDIYISGEIGTAKTGDLFLKFRTFVPAEKYLHIGDNKLADGLFARANGIDAFLIPSALEMFHSSKCGELISYAGNINERSMLGLFASRCFNDPFKKSINAKINILNMEDFVFFFMAPLITKFMFFLLDELHNRKYEAILFAARDGLLIKYLYDWVRTHDEYNWLPQSIYFYISRKAVISASLTDKGEVKFARDTFGIEFLKNTFSTVQTDEIISKSCKIRKNFLKYVKHLNLTSNRSYAFFDLMSSATSQYYLGKIFFHDIVGMYFSHHWRNCGYSKVRCNSMLLDYYDRYGLHNLDNVVIWEAIVTSEDSSVDSYDDMGRPIFSESKKSEREIELIKKSQSILNDYFRVYFEKLYDSRSPVNTSFALKFWSLREDYYARVDVKIFQDISIDEGISNTKIYVNHHDC